MTTRPWVRGVLVGGALLLLGPPPAIAQAAEVYGVSEAMVKFRLNVTGSDATVRDTGLPDRRPLLAFQRDHTCVGRVAGPAGEPIPG